MNSGRCKIFLILIFKIEWKESEHTLNNVHEIQLAS